MTTATRTSTRTRTATDAQITFYTKLFTERVEMYDKLDATAAAAVREVMDESVARFATRTVREASTTIDRVLENNKALRAEVRKVTAAAAPAAPATEALTHGMYKVGETIYKVQEARNGSGRLYAKLLVNTKHEDGTYSTSFEYAPGAVRNLTVADRMSLEDAKVFGALYGTCCNCGRTLTDETSIEAGIGPVCRSRF